MCVVWISSLIYSLCGTIIYKIITWRKITVLFRANFFPDWFGSSIWTNNTHAFLDDSHQTNINHTTHTTHRYSIQVLLVNHYHIITKMNSHQKRLIKKNVKFIHETLVVVWRHLILTWNIIIVEKMFWLQYFVLVRSVIHHHRHKNWRATS